MLWKLMLMMTVVPAVELYILLQIGDWIGPMETFLLVVITGVLGASLAKRAGLGVLAKLQEDARSGVPPADRLVEAALVLAGGILLLTPGVCTDTLGLLMMVQPVRRALVPRLREWSRGRFNVQGVRVGEPQWGDGVEQTVTADTPAPPSDPTRFEHPEL